MYGSLASIYDVGRASSDKINSAPKATMNALRLVCTGKPPPWGLTLEGDMNAISDVSTPTVSEAQTNYTVNAIAVICGLCVVVFVCLATSGLDMSVGFF